MYEEMLKQGLSIVMPVYNEAAIIESVIREFYEKVVCRITCNVEFIIAEDGSRDGTKSILRKLNEEIPFVLISSEQRKGYARAFRDALAQAKNELVFFSDSDGQHDPKDFFELLKEISTTDIVSGYKLTRSDPLYRIIFSRAYNFLIYLFFGLKMKDINSGFKLIRRSVIGNVLEGITTLHYCVMSEFILKSYLKGYRIREVAIRHYPRTSGSSAIFSLLRLPSIIIETMIGLLKIRLSYAKR